MIPVQTSIVGYSGKAVTLFSAYDEDADVLVVSVEADFRKARRDGCMVITNDLKLERDSLFTEDDLQKAISAFFNMQQGVASDQKSPRLVFADKAMRANPAQSIEKDGVDSSGQRYRISENITCAQVAALAACWYADSRVTVVEEVLDMAERLYDIDILARGGIFTI